jgi:hypothetical protein
MASELCHQLRAHRQHTSSASTATPGEVVDVCNITHDHKHALDKRMKAHSSETATLVSKGPAAEAPRAPL